MRPRTPQHVPLAGQNAAKPLATAAARKVRGRAELIEEARSSLERMQEFDATTLARTDELGAQLDFSSAVSHSHRLVELFRQVSLDILEALPRAQLIELRQLIDAELDTFQEVRTFSVTDGTPKTTRNALIQQLETAYDRVFAKLCPVITYSATRAFDFARLEQEANAAVQAIEARATELEQALAARKNEADEALDAIRKVAEEQGVSQHAVYFKNEAEAHEAESAKWLSRTTWLTVLLAGFAMASMLLHKIPWLKPEDSFEAAQLLLSKALVFGTLASFLVLSARNYLAHQHNYIVNKHRKNSLVTYRALVEAAGDQANRDVVLAKAAESIFGSQATGFTKDGGDAGPRSNISLSPTLLKTSSGG